MSKYKKLTPYAKLKKMSEREDRANKIILWSRSAFGKLPEKDLELIDEIDENLIKLNFLL